MLLRVESAKAARDRRFHSDNYKFTGDVDPSGQRNAREPGRFGDGRFHRAVYRFCRVVYYDSPAAAQRDAGSLPRGVRARAGMSPGPAGRVPAPQGARAPTSVPSHLILYN